MSNHLQRKIAGSEVFCLGFGTANLGGGYSGGQTKPDEERLKVLDAAYEAGCNLWDTADSYHDSEELIGKWLKRTGKRDQIFIASKFGVNRQTMTIDGRPEFARKQVDTQGADVIPIFGTTRIEALKENVASAKLQLMVQEVSEIRKAAETADAANGSARYPPSMQELHFVDTPPM